MATGSIRSATGSPPTSRPKERLQRIMVVIVVVMKVAMILRKEEEEEGCAYGRGHQ